MTEEEKNRRMSDEAEPITATEIRGVKYYDVHSDYTPKGHKIFGLSSRKKRRLGTRFGRKRWGRTRDKNKAKPKQRSMRADKSNSKK
jgi:hypothetical protein